MTTILNVPALPRLTAAELERWQDQPRDCTGPCKRTLTRGHFQLTRCHGSAVLRSWCRECLASYFRKRNRRKRED